MCENDGMPLKRADLRKRAEEKAAELAAEGMELHPVTASGRNLAKKFWGKEWMKSLAACEVYGMRLAPGRTYLRQTAFLNKGLCIDLYDERTPELTHGVLQAILSKL